jgi:AAA family ATP:ADP antiporter
MRGIIGQKEHITEDGRQNGVDEPAAKGSAWAAFKQVAASPYLIGISIFVLLLTSASTLLYLEQQRIVAEAIKDKGAQTTLFATIDFWVQAASLIAQFFIFSRALRWFGLTFTISFYD